MIAHQDRPARASRPRAAHALVARAHGAAALLLALTLALATAFATAPAARAQGEPGMDPAPAPIPGSPDGEPEHEKPAEPPLIPEMPTPTAGPAAPQPGPGFDYDAYAEQMYESARTSADTGEGAKVVAYVKYLRGPLGQTAFVKGHLKQLDELERRGNDLQAEACYRRADELAPKNAAKAKEKLAELRGSYGGSSYVQLHRLEIEALEAKVRTSLWEGKAAWRGTALLPFEGVLRLGYELSGVEELADFAFAGKAAPKVDAGRLQLVKNDGVLRHRLQVPEGGSFTAEIEARGAGRIALVLEGEAPTASLAKETLVEIEVTDKTMHAAVGRADDKTRPEATAQRPGNTSASATWYARVERRDGKLRAVLLPDGPPAAAGASAPTGTAAPAPKEVVAERGAGADPQKPGTGPAFRAGFAALSGKVEIDRLVIVGPLPAAPAGEATAAATRPPLPTKTWIPLSKKGKDDWKETGKWSYDGESIKQGGGPATLVSKELEGRPLEKYSFTVDVKLDEKEAKRPRGMQQPQFAIVLPVGEEGLAWVFTGRDTHLDGVEDTRFLGQLPPDQWTTLSVKADGKKIEFFLGSKSIFVAAQDKVSDSKLAGKSGGISLRTFPGVDKIEFRAPKIRLD